MSSIPTLTTWKKAKTFKKKTGTTNHGHSYENFFVAHLILKLLLDVDVKDFRLSSNDESFGSFDDVVLETKDSHGNVKFYAIQTKHSNKAKVLMKQRFGERSGDFAIEQYFEGSQNFQNIRLILYTNLKYDNGGKKGSFEIEGKKITIVKAQEVDLLKSSEKGRCYSFQSDQTKYKRFFREFRLYTDQASFGYLRTRTREMFCKNFDGGQNVFDRFAQFVTNWSNIDGEKDKLDRRIVQEVLAICSFTRFVKPLSFSSTSALNEKEELLREAISKFDITIVSDCDELKLWRDKKSLLNNLKEVNRVRIKYNIKEDYIGNVDVLTGEEIGIFLWLLKICPLVLKGNQTLYTMVKICQSKNLIIVDESFGSSHLPNLPVFQNLDDLKQFGDTYTKILDKFSVSIQGKSELSLNELKLTKIITTKELLLMTKQPLTIGGEKEILPEAYMPRLLTRPIISYEFLDTIDNTSVIIIIGDIQELENNISGFNLLRIEEFPNCDRNQKNIYISDQREIEVELSNTRYYLFADFNNKGLEWIRSNCDIQKIRKSQIEGYYLDESEIYSSQSMNLLCAESGMGKTTFVKNLKNNLAPDIWTIEIYPIDHHSLLQKTITFDEFKTYILKRAEEIHGTLSKQSLEVLLEEKKVCLIWDALDEMQDQKNIFSIVHEISKMGIKQWLTSKTQLRKMLENEFRILSRSIKEIDEEQQKNYFEKRGIGSNVFEKIKDNIRFSYMHRVLGNPFLLYILTELFKDADKDVDSLPQIMSVSDLYEHFLQTKFDLFKQHEDPYRAGYLNKIIERYRRYVVRDYEKVSVKILFEDLDLDCDEFLNEVRTEGDVVGIITKITKDNHPKFFHESLVEYFAASFLSKHFGNVSQLKRRIFGEKYTKVRFFLDLLLSRKNRAHFAVLYRELHLLKQCTEDELRERDRGGRNVLHLACSWGTKYPPLGWDKVGEKYVIDDAHVPKMIKPDQVEVDILKFLLEKCDASEIDQVFKMDAFSYASESLSLLSLAILTSKSRREMPYDSHTTLTILYYSVVFDYGDIFRNLKQLPLVEIKSAGRSLLYLAISSKSLNCTRRILSNNLYRKLVEENVEPFLHVACKTQCYDIVQLLINTGASVNAPGANGEMPLHHACGKNGRYAIAKLLIDNGASVNVTSEYIGMPINQACFFGHLEILKLLIEKGADVNFSNENIRTPLYDACTKGFHVVVKLLIENQANFRLADEFGEIPIHYACTAGHFSVVEELLEHDIDLKIKDRHNEIAIHYAARFRHYEIMRLLVTKGSELEIPDRYGLMPLHYACADGHNIVKFLVKYCVNVDITDKSGRTPLHLACAYGHQEVATHLIDEGAGVNIRCVNGKTPLHYACARGDYKTVELLIGKGADVNAEDDFIGRPIHVACEKGHLEIVRLLIENRAEANAGAKYCPKPVEMAKQHPEVLNFLKSVSGNG